MGRWEHCRAGRGAVCHTGPRGHPAVCQLAADGHLGPGLAPAATRVSAEAGSAAPPARQTTVILSKSASLGAVWAHQKNSTLITE